MGVIDGAMNLVFGGGRNIVRETAGVFMENAEQRAVREAMLQSSALAQFSSEFALPKKGFFDRFIDGLNRVPRPALALGTIGLFVSAMVNPIWFAARMNGLALVPEPLWWLMGAIVSFYFGARHQVKSQEFQRSVATTIASTGAVVQNLETLDNLEAGSRSQGDPNPALDAWQRDGQ
ncbi:MAG: holin family protein [Pseudomonadota bacterium]|nr:holin family protein [Pseudomonadota bacterium]